MWNYVRDYCELCVRTKQAWVTGLRFVRIVEYKYASGIMQGTKLIWV